MDSETHLDEISHLEAVALKMEPGSILVIRPPAGIDLTQREVEVVKRGIQERIPGIMVLVVGAHCEVDKTEKSQWTDIAVPDAAVVTE